MSYPDKCSDDQGALGTAEIVLDPDRLSELLGQPARAVRLRHKPGRSTVAAVGDPDGKPTGWVLVCEPVQVAKIDNAVRRASRRGVELPVLDAGRGRLAVAGAIDTDPRLHKALREVADDLGPIATAASSGRVKLLRYNPMRRLVIKDRSIIDRPMVLRLTAERRPPPTRLLAALADAGVPLVCPDAAQSGRRVSAWPWVGSADLASRPDRAHAERAGAALARLHAVDADRVAGRCPRRDDTTADRLERVRADLADLDAGAADRFARVLTGLDLDVRGPVVTHADFSADQVLVGRKPDDLWLSDFDRVEVGDRYADLGSFVATERLAGRAGLVAGLLEGYQAPVDRRRLEIWTAVELLLRILDPFRDAAVGWRRLVHDRLRMVEEGL